jgi:hypothetical protein
MRQGPVGPPERPAGADFRCPAKGVVVSGEDEVFDWTDSAVNLRRVTGEWSWRSLGADPGNPLLCIDIGHAGTRHRLVDWFNVDTDEYQGSPDKPLLALLRGQTQQILVRASPRETEVGAIVLVASTEWHAHGHEKLDIGGRGYDTLVFDLTGSSTRNSFTGAGRVWYAPALGLFVRKIWRASNSDDVVGWSVTGVAAGGGAG